MSDQEHIEEAAEELNTAIEAAAELKIVHGWSVDEIIDNIKTAIEGME